MGPLLQIDNYSRNFAVTENVNRFDSSLPLESEPQLLKFYEDLISEIIENKRLTSWFQPIISLPESRLIGFEALIRGPSDTPLHAPQALFDIAHRCGKFNQIELLARETHIAAFAAKGLPGKLFLNVTPSAILQNGFPLGATRKLLEMNKLDPRRVVIELTEQYPVGDFDLINKALDHYRNMGFSVALDDLGAAYAGLRRWSELIPDYVKFDRYFIQGIDKDPIKQQFIHSLHEIAHGLGCLTIAEGVETRAEYLFLKSVGIGCGQGYFFARPSATPSKEITFSLVEPGDQITEDDVPSLFRSEKVGSLVRHVPTVTSNERLNKVGELLETFPDIWTLPVVDDGRPVGTVKRTKIFDILASRFGRDLHGRNPIIEFMDTTPLLIDKNVPVEKLSRIITDNTELTHRDDFIITENDNFLGIGTLADLLRKVTDLQLRNARYANPLTMLPGNVPINEMIDHLVGSGKTFTVCYCDIDHFKAYNDYYGYNKGDNVIRLLAQILKDTAVVGLDFVGHIGGDDFIVIFLSEDWQKRCELILAEFDRQVRDLYAAKELDNNGIVAENRSGDNTFYPVASLSIGSIYLTGNHGFMHHEISSRAAHAKSQAKKFQGSYHFVERRLTNNT